MSSLIQYHQTGLTSTEFQSPDFNQGSLRRRKASIYSTAERADDEDRDGRTGERTRNASFAQGVSVRTGACSATPLLHVEDGIGDEGEKK
uniref:Uncharacterized protein n=1 Tax=Nelumbo nucifera TaxID=4432 RepID=A0A822XFR4_NELNU|nr:TPA_asm: hypothetical protein HUJ06_019976 [Nelumbo nucifera]